MGQTKFRRQPYITKKPKKHKRHPIIKLMMVLLIVFGAWFVFGKKIVYSPVPKVKESINSVISQSKQSVEQKSNLPNIQKTVDEYINNHPGSYAIKITDFEGRTLAETNGDKQFFTASVYKLFVAYAGYQKVDDGTHDLDESYISGYTYGECLDAMIRDSFSPCAEVMMADLNGDNITTQVRGYGLINTSLSGFYTSANDTAIMLKRIATGEGLSDSSKKAFLDSMKTQDNKYRLGLPSGFKKSTVYNKVGWNEDQEWHDASIVELPNGKKAIIAVLTTGAGYKNVSQLGSVIENALLE